MLVWLLKKWRDPLLVFLLWILDMVGLAARLRPGLRPARAMGGLLRRAALSRSPSTGPLLLFSWLLATLTFLLTGRYRPRPRPGRRSAGEHLQQVGMVAVLLLASTYLGHLEVISRAVLLMFIPLLAVFTAVGEDAVPPDPAPAGTGTPVPGANPAVWDRPRPVGAWLAGAGDLAGQGVDVAGYLAEPGRTGPAAPGRGRCPLARDTRPKCWRWSSATGFPRSCSGTGRRPATQAWAMLAALRRLRVRLRWQVEDVWLLAAGARAEVFGGALSAVKGSGSGTAVRAVWRPPAVGGRRDLYWAWWGCCPGSGSAWS